MKRLFSSALFSLLWLSQDGLAAADYYVAVNGNNTNPGTLGAPFQTLARAQSAVRAALPTARSPIHVWVRGGTYYLGQPLAFGPQDSGSAAFPVTYSAYRNETVTLSGAIKLTPRWTPYPGNTSMMVANIGPDLDLDALFINGEQQVLARYPNYTAETDILNGYAADCLSPNRAARWSNPATGLVRGLHGSLWGGNSFKIIGLDAGGRPMLQWMGDNNRGDSLHPTYRLVENLFEELDAPREWFYNRTNGNLFFYPPPGLNLATARVEAATLSELAGFRGFATNQVVHHITLSNFIFAQTHRTLFNLPYEGLMRGDWAVARAGALYLSNAENIVVQNCVFTNLGGNGIFMSAFNRSNIVNNNEFVNVGATCVQLVGLASATRSPSTWAKQLTNLQDTNAGPLTMDYPQNILVTSNHMFNLGTLEKQSAGVNISVAESITVGHNTIHRSPRSGINVNCGCFGGHLIEFNDVFDCVRETSDHGPFNAWGRDRFWSYLGCDSNGGRGTAKKPYAFLDAGKTVTLRNNRFHYSSPSTWGIDLDDGASNYDIYNNLCLNTGFKLREGFGRKVHNNILVNQAGNFHVWFDGCGDEVCRNIFIAAAPYGIIGINSDTMAAKGATIDYNLFYYNGSSVRPGFPGWTNLGFDVHSVVAAPQFTDPAHMDYSVARGSPALSLGFTNFPMNQFGKPGAPTPAPVVSAEALAPPADPEPFLGATITSVYSDAIKSVVGLADNQGVYFETVPVSSEAAALGFRANDVIRTVNSTRLAGKRNFWTLYHSCAPGSRLTLTLRRNQVDQSFSFLKPAARQQDSLTGSMPAKR